MAQGEAGVEGALKAGQDGGKPKEDEDGGGVGSLGYTREEKHGDARARERERGREEMRKRTQGLGFGV